MPIPGVSGYGQFEPDNSSHPYNVWEFIISQWVKANVVTAKVVQVVAVYDHAGGTVDGTDTGQVGPTGSVDVKPLVLQQDGVGNTMEHGIVNSLQFARVQGGKNAVIMDPQVGDIGLIVVADRDSSAVKAGRTEGPPGSKRTYDIADGMYVCSLLNSNTPVQYIRFLDTGIELRDENDNVIVTGKSGVTITDTNGNVVNMAAGSVEVTPASGIFKVVGQILATEDITAGSGTGDSVTLLGHTHTQPPDGHGDQEFPVNPPTPGT